MIRVRVLWVIKTLGPGGAERLLCDQAKVRNRDEFHVECAFVDPDLDHLADELERAGVRTTCVSRRRQDILWPFRLAALVRDAHWDVVHVHSPLPASVVRMAVLTMRRDNRPAIISTEHNRWVTFHPLTRLAHSATSGLDTATIAVSSEVAASMTGRARIRARVVRHGIDLEAVTIDRRSRTAVRAELDIAADEFVVCTAASFRPQKDYPNLLAAARALADRNVPIRFVAIGQGPLEEDIRRLRTDLGLGHRVIFTGFRDDARRVMAACDLFVLSSRWEGLPVAIMEACALGLPIVATKVGGIAEEFVHDETAVLVPPGSSTTLADAIERVYEDHRLWARMASAAIASAARFDVRRTQSVLEDIYRNVAPHGSVSRSAGTLVAAWTPVEGIEIRECRDDERSAVIEFCRAASLVAEGEQFVHEFDWRHTQSPFGASLILVAVDDTGIIGVGIWRRWSFLRGATVVRAALRDAWVIRGDVHQQAISDALERASRERLAAEGVAFAICMSDNQNPAVASMDHWREVGRLPVALRIMRPDSVARLVSLVQRTTPRRVPVTTGRAVADALDDVRIIAERDRLVRSGITDVRGLRTEMTDDFLRWRYGSAISGARLVLYGAGGIIVTARRRGDALECALLESLALSPLDTDRAVAEAARDMGADYVIRAGDPCVSTGFMPLVGLGPRLMWQSMEAGACPALTHWHVSLGTIDELGK